jgi:hypothetical protein
MNVHTSTMAINLIFFNKIFIVQINFKRRLVMVCNKFCLKKNIKIKCLAKYVQGVYK